MMSPMWDDFAAITCPMMLVRGGISPVVDDEDEAEARRRQPDLRVESVDGAGHSIQGDRPVELAALIDDFVFR
jgi:pimeloyl-ACP methyl ester carboxylesterase